MKTKGTRSVFIYFVTITIVCMITLPCAYAAFFYKSYVIRYDRGRNILCDPYVVKKNDWVFKLFRQKGEISNRDFPEFLRIFKRLNPNIQDIDRIRPGQHIVIPLKKVDQDELPEQSSGIVTIPYLTHVTLPDDTTKYSTDYRVKKGDCISILISEKYGKYGTQSYQKGEKLFRLMNPKIENLNLIYSGQMIRLPDPKIQKESQAQTPLDSEAIHKIPEKDRPDSSVAFDEKTSLSSGVNNRKEPSDSLLSKVASVLDAKLFDKGNYYLPRPGQKDYKVDLSQTPFLKLEDGKRVFFNTGDEKQNSDIKMLKSFWKDVLIVNVAPDDSMEKVFNTVFRSLEAGVIKHRLSFSDHGVEVEVQGKWIIEKPRRKGEAIRYLCITVIDDSKERTPQSIIRYLDQNDIIIKEILIGKRIKEPKSNGSRFNIADKNPDIIDASDHETFVKDFLIAMGYQYSPNKNISFEYAGIQINAASNLAAKSNDNIFYIDFGNFYGDAIHAIEKSGYSIIQVKENDSLDDIIQKLTGAMNASLIKSPTFLAAKRPADHNTRLTIPGFLMDHAGLSGVLLTLAPLHHGVVHFLTDNDIRIIRMNLQGKKNE
ncbi:MAG: LysM peptidoglycan-binding domain-containing protein [Deltaproteobacteria bacterium]|nr:LysM peptidoglycan-binding domain-containing protein [Deltaproteobacteria bacterium]